MFWRLIPVAVFCLQAYGQSFEVASIKIAAPLGPFGTRADRKGGPGTSDPGTYSCLNCPLSWVVSEAFQLHSFDYSAPDWMDNSRFDVQAKIPAGTTKPVFQKMLQNLLADRFALVVHREKKEMPVYELTVAKGGPKFKDGAPKDAPKDDGAPGKMKRDADGFPILAPGTSMALVSGRGRLQSENQPIAWFTELMSGQLQSPVIDATGLKGTYDFVVSWKFSQGNNAGAEEGLEPFLGALLTAVQEQLGLRLDKKKGAAEVLVVDHISKAPIAN